MRKAAKCVRPNIAPNAVRGLRNDGGKTPGPINLGGALRPELATPLLLVGHLAGNDDFLFVRLQYLTTIDLLVKHTATHFESRRTVRAMGSPIQKMWMTTPMTIPLKSNGRLGAAERGTTMRFMKK